MRPHYLKTIALFVILTQCSFSHAQYITTIIGNGSSACNLNDAAPLCLPLSYPQSVCVAPNEDIFFTCGNAVKKLSRSTGLVTMIAGSDSYGSSGDGGPAINALFQVTRAVKTDKQGNLYIAEYSGHRIRKINTATGIITTVAGNGIAGYSGDGSPATNARINTPADIAIDDAGNIFIADFRNSCIRKVNAATGIISTVAGIGVASYSGDGGAATNAGIPYPNSICLDATGNLYISESLSSNSCRIRKVDAATGIINTIAGNNSYSYSGDGGPAVNASLFDPSGVMVDAAGNVYISEYDDSRIRKIDVNTGLINTVAGNGVNGFSGDNGLAVAATLKAPIGLAVDKAGDLLICDNQNLRIRKLYTHAGAAPTGNPVIAITAPTTEICGTGTITFTAAADYTVAGSYYVWTKNGAVVGTDSTQWTGTGLQPGDMIQCTLPYPQCVGTTKVKSNIITLTGSTSQALTVSIATSKTTICKNDNVVFTATTSQTPTGTIYQWKLNNNNTGTNATTYSNASLADGDVVSCEVTSPASLPCITGGKVVSNNITMHVNNPLTASVTITASSDKICAGTLVNFQANLQNGNISTLIQWKLNGTNVGDNSTYFNNSNLVNNDEVYCMLTDLNGCTSPVSSNTIKLSVENPPLIKLTPSDTVVNLGSQVQLQAVINGAYAGYTWTPAAGLINANNLSPVTIPLQSNAVYSIRAASAGNCADTATAIIKIQQKLRMPTAFSPNGDTRNDMYRIPPNVSLQLKNFSIYDRWGKRVFSTTDINAGWDGRINNKMQDNGTYVYIITGNDYNGSVFLKGTFLLIK
ncbi:MAG: gliding motility-associated C-terminal domain-containing protein [Chitinophagaceae bacterium]